jgi:hypothetical protein
MDKAGEYIAGVIAAVISLAVLGVVLSARSNTVGVMSAFFQGMAGLIGVAISPTTGTNAGAFAGQQLAQGSGLFGVNSAGNSTFGSSSLGGSLGVATPGFALNLSGLGQTIGAVSNLFGSSGGTGGSGTGFVDSGSFSDG